MIHAALSSSFWSSAAPAWLAGIGTIIVAIVAVFQEWIRGLLVRPKLRLAARVQRPDAEKTKWTNGADVYYFRLAVTNEGNTAALDVQVYLAAVERQAMGGQYIAVDRFTPMNLVWSHVGTTTLSVLLPGMPPRFCDMAHITDPGLKHVRGENLPGIAPNIPVLALDLEVLPNSKGHLLEPGTYRFSLKLAASNHRPEDYSLRVVFPGKWFTDQNQMFSDGLGMKLL